MKGIKFNSSLVTALAVGLAFALPISPAFAQQKAPDKKGWVLVDTKTVREFVPNPAKPGRGNWKLKAVNDRKYFVPNSKIGETEERVLDGSKELSSKTEKANEKFDPKSKDTDVYKGNPRDYQETGGSAVVRRLEGRSYNTYKVWPVSTKREVKTYQRFDTWDEHSYDERTVKTLRNTYRVKKELTFLDPKTNKQMKAKTEKVLPAVDELAYGGWSKKGPFKVNTGKSEKVIDVQVTEVARKQGKELLSANPSADFDAGTGAAMGGSGGLAFSGDRGQGSAGAAHSGGSAAEKLAGAEKAKSAGADVKIPKAAFDALYTAAATGLTLADNTGAAWALSYDGQSLLMASGGTAFRLPKGVAQAGGSRPGTFVKLDKADVKGDAITLTGMFKSGKGQPATSLKSGK
ncbi:MAG: hypothetical protein FJZ01_10480 [Candidatus Sericytochromatia bacterium]|nr:hypothetical protein [Candidatus Tanganyikabacteria bacterium]